LPNDLGAGIRAVGHLKEPLDKRQEDGLVAARGRSARSSTVRHSTGDLQKISQVLIAIEHRNFEWRISRRAQFPLKK
jgi:hypothetical protein